MYKICIRLLLDMTWTLFLFSSHFLSDSLVLVIPLLSTFHPLLQPLSQFLACVDSLSALLLSWRQSASLLPTSVCSERQTDGRWRLMIQPASMAVFIRFFKA